MIETLLVEFLGEWSGGRSDKGRLKCSFLMSEEGEERPLSPEECWVLAEVSHAHDRYRVASS
jgi:hypothetical protein